MAKLTKTVVAMDVNHNYSAFHITKDENNVTLCYAKGFKCWTPACAGKKALTLEDTGNDVRIRWAGGDVSIPYDAFGYLTLAIDELEWPENEVVEVKRG